MTIEDFLMPNNFPSQKTTNSNLSTSKELDFGECISINKTKRKHKTTHQSNNKAKTPKTETKTTTNLDMVNKDISKISEYYTLYNVVDEEFQKVLNSFSEN